LSKCFNKLAKHVPRWRAERGIWVSPPRIGRCSRRRAELRCKVTPNVLNKDSTSTTAMSESLRLSSRRRWRQREARATDDARVLCVFVRRSSDWVGSRRRYWFSFFIRSSVQLRYPSPLGARAGRLYIDGHNTKERAGGGGGVRLRPTSMYGEHRGRPYSVWGRQRTCCSPASLPVRAGTDDGGGGGPLDDGRRTASDVYITLFRLVYSVEIRHRRLYRLYWSYIRCGTLNELASPSFQHSTEYE